MSAIKVTTIVDIAPAPVSADRHLIDKPLIYPAVIENVSLYRFVATYMHEYDHLEQITADFDPRTENLISNIFRCRTP
jgi:hypothetical protein